MSFVNPRHLASASAAIVLALTMSGVVARADLTGDALTAASSAGHLVSPTVSTLAAQTASKTFKCTITFEGNSAGIVTTYSGTSHCTAAARMTTTEGVSDPFIGQSQSSTCDTTNSPPASVTDTCTTGGTMPALYTDPQTVTYDGAYYLPTGYAWDTTGWPASCKKASDTEMDCHLSSPVELIEVDVQGHGLHQGLPPTR
jgi:hypothetical protein